MLHPFQTAIRAGSRTELGHFSRCRLPVGLLFSLLSAASVGSDSIDPPDIRIETLQEYVHGGGDNAEMKIRMSVYLDSLGSELAVLANDVEACLANTPELLTAFREAHLSFLDFAEDWSEVVEDVQWYDLSTGELYWGTGYGYSYTWCRAELYWERILVYRQFLDEGLSEGFGSFPITSTDVGGS